VGMCAAYCYTYLIGTRVILRREQGTYHCEPLGRDGNPLLTTTRDELAESFSGIPLTPLSVHQSEFLHKCLAFVSSFTAE
jgi:hypothetical protein